MCSSCVSVLPNLALGAEHLRTKVEAWEQKLFPQARFCGSGIFSKHFLIVVFFGHVFVFCSIFLQFLVRGLVCVPSHLGKTGTLLRAHFGVWKCRYNTLYLQLTREPCLSTRATFIVCCMCQLSAQNSNYNKDQKDLQKQTKHPTMLKLVFLQLTWKLFKTGFPNASLASLVLVILRGFYCPKVSKKPEHTPAMSSVHIFELLPCVFGMLCKLVFKVFELELAFLQTQTQSVICSKTHTDAIGWMTVICV